MQGLLKWPGRKPYLLWTKIEGEWMIRMGLQSPRSRNDGESGLCIQVVFYICNVHFFFQCGRLQIGLHYLPEERKFYVAVQRQ